MATALRGPAALTMVAMALLLLLGACLVNAQANPTPFPVPDFNCPAQPAPPPTNYARQLRPGNIKAIMTIGDSISAGFAMQGNLPANFMEWRDSVYSIGAKPGAKTLFNFVKNKYNAAVMGGAEGITLPMTRGSWLDAAVSGAVIADGMGQLDYLLRTLQASYKMIDIQNDWKLMTIFMGANDLCHSCHAPLNTTISNFDTRLRQLVSTIEQKMPRTFVQLIGIFNISGVWDVAQTDPYCQTVWSVVKTECTCLQNGNPADRVLMDQGSLGINRVMERLAGEYATRNTSFHVTYQPGLTNLAIPSFGRPFLSNLDCFHPSLPADETFAYQIWNNLQEPAGSKSRMPNPQSIQWKCPSQDSFLQ